MSQSCILIHQMSFHLQSGKSIFKDINLTFLNHRTGLVGKNGLGKSTFFKLILGDLCPSSGSIHSMSKLAYVPQQISFSEKVTVADVLSYADKLNALHRITQGSTNEKDFTILNEEWDIEDRLQKQLEAFGLQNLPVDRKIKMLSGGETTRLLLANAFFSDADFLLLDEPTNHLDHSARQQLYAAIQQWQGGMCVISHDRALINLMNEIVELTSLGVSSYGGNYNLYEEQKNIEKLAAEQQLENAKKRIQKTKNSVQSSREKHEQKQSYGKELKRSGSIDKLGANSKKGRSERTQSKLLVKEQRMMQQEKIEIIEKIKLDVPATRVPNGKVILDIENLCFSYGATNLIDDFSLKMVGPARIALSGDNGSGKTTLIKLILPKLDPSNKSRDASRLDPHSGRIFIGTEHISYLDQNASSLNPETSILENFLQMNLKLKKMTGIVH